MTSQVDPVNLEPIPPLSDSYLFNSSLPDKFEQHNEEGWIMGIDEAGRGRASCLSAFWAVANRR